MCRQQAEFERRRLEMEQEKVNLKVELPPTISTIVNPSIFSPFWLLPRTISMSCVKSWKSSWRPTANWKNSSHERMLSWRLSANCCRRCRRSWRNFPHRRGDIAVSLRHLKCLKPSWLRGSLLIGPCHIFFCCPLSLKPSAFRSFFSAPTLSTQWNSALKSDATLTPNVSLKVASDLSNRLGNVLSLCPVCMFPATSLYWSIHPCYMVLPFVVDVGASFSESP